MHLNQSAEFSPIIRALAATGSDFVVIGGLAVILHGGDHRTVDVDFAINHHRANAKALAAALAPYHPRPLNFPADLPYVWDEEVIMRSQILTLTTDLGRVDLLAEASGSPPYKELKKRALAFQLEGHTVYFASLDDMISMKRASGRPKDLLHLDELQTIKQLLEKDPNPTQGELCCTPSSFDRTALQSPVG